MSADAQAPAPEGPGELRPDSKSVEKAVPKKRTQNRKEVSAVESVAQPLASPTSSVVSNLKDPPAAKKEAREWSNTVIALIAVVVAIASILYTAFQDRTNHEDQRVQRATSQAVATVQQATAQAAATSDASLAQEVVSLKKTQTASEADQARMLRMQVFPFMHTTEDNPAVLTLTDARIITDTGGSLLIRGAGQFSTTLANDGGANAGLTAVRWSGSSTGGRIHNLNVGSVAMRGKGVLELPSTIERQSATRVDLKMAGEITATSDLIGKTPYQLGRVLSDTLQAEGTNVVFQFSNTEPLTVTVQAIDLEVPAQAIRTDPPSPFVVTEADQTGVVRLKLIGEGVGTGGQARILISGPEGAPTMTVGASSMTRFTLPVRNGEYHLRLQFEDAPTITVASVAFRVIPSEERLLEIPYPKPATAHSTPPWLPNPSQLFASIGVLAASLASGGVLLGLSRRRIRVEWKWSDGLPRARPLLFSALRQTQIVRLEPDSSAILVLHRERAGYAVGLQDAGTREPIRFVMDAELGHHSVSMSWPDHLSVTISLVSQSEEQS